MGEWYRKSGAENAKNSSTQERKRPHFCFPSDYLFPKSRRSQNCFVKKVHLGGGEGGLLQNDLKMQMSIVSIRKCFSAINSPLTTSLLKYDLFVN